MRAEEILDAIGNVNDESIKHAKERNKPKKAVWITAGSVAACIVIVFMIHNISNFIGYGGETYGGNHEVSRSAIQSGTELAVASDYIRIYYVNGNEIDGSSVYLDCTPQDVFRAWREKNGIGDEVELISIRSVGNGEDFVSGGVAGHKVGDHFVLYMIVSKNIENYYGEIDSKLLLDSLEKTMMEYTDSDEYNISFE